jgi:hypothetical protein
MARAAALVRVDPDDRRGTTSDRAVPAWALVDQDDGAQLTDIEEEIRDPSGSRFNLRLAVPVEIVALVEIHAGR